jgi:nucleotide-binding universal stress UspA family protein
LQAPDEIWLIQVNAKAGTWRDITAYNPILGMLEEHVMKRKILCPTDGSDHSTQAVIQAAELAAAQSADLTICAVNVAHGGGRGPLIQHWTDAQMEKILADAADLARRSGAGEVHTAAITSREAAAGIVTYAETHSIDHIVVGTGDKRGISRLMLGSVAADVAGRAHCSVTVAR